MVAVKRRAFHVWGPTRRWFIAAGSALAGGLGLSTVGKARTENTSVISGAIRWDAWYAPDSTVGQQVEKSLAPSQFHYRMPFFGKVIDQDHVFIDGNHQNLFDEEINYARHIGLNYWAYCWYPIDNPLQNGWKLHQASSIKNRMNWCMIWQLGWLKDAATFEDQFQPYPAYFLQPNYQKVLDGRSLVYLYVTGQDPPGAAWNNNWASLAAALDKLRTRCRAAGCGLPYLVIMRDPPTEAADIMRKLGADAISNYIAPVPQGPARPFQSLYQFTQRYWARMAETGASVVPIAMTGWDTRPRKLHPPSWEHAPIKPGAAEYYIVPGTAQEIAAEIEAARDFVINNGRACPARSILIYSWDECDEGGGALIPAYHPS